MSIVILALLVIGLPASIASNEHAESSLAVTPFALDESGFAELSHGGPSEITVTVSNALGETMSVLVPPRMTVKWLAPPGWQQARFKSVGCDEVFRLIQ